MKPIRTTITVDRPRQEVYDHLDVLANHEAFCDHFMVDWRLSGPRTGVGATLNAKVRAFGREEAFELTVVDAKAPETIAEVSVGAGGRRRTRGTYYLAEAGPDRTEVTFELVTESLPASERLVAPLTRPWLSKQNARAMERLKEQLERVPLAA